MLKGRKINSWALMGILLTGIFILISVIGMNDNKSKVNFQNEIVNAVTQSNSQNVIKDEDLIGIWHISPSLFAGWADRYFFFKDKSFRFDYSQYDEAKRVIDMSGTWSVINNQLILIITAKTVVKGGELVKSTSESALSEYQIINGKIQKEDVDPQEKIVYSLSAIEKNDKYPHPISIKIGGKQFWKYYDDPNSLK